MNIWLIEIWRAWRASLRRPGFLLLAVTVLGLGIGASTGAFSLVRQTLLRPPPFPHPDRLLVMGMVDIGFPTPITTPRQYQHLQAMQGVVAIGLVTRMSVSFNVYGNGTPRQVEGVYADRQLLPTLGLHVALGHNFSAREDAPGGPPVVMLGHGFWEREYGGRADVIGQQLVVRGEPRIVIGVLPARFDAFCQRFLGRCDIVVPTALSPQSTDGSGMYLAIARLASGVTPRSVSDQMQARMQQLVAASSQAWLKSQKFGADGLSSALFASSRPTLLLFMAAGMFVLLIAAVNLTNLLFLRTLARRHEGAIRDALGAPSWRNHLPVYAESGLVVVLSTLLGVALAATGSAAFRHFVPAATFARLDLLPDSLHVGVGSCVFALLAAVVVALVATALGLRKGRRFQLGSELRDGGRSGADPGIGRLGRTLVVVQVALATVLLAGAGLFVHAVVSASRVDLGFNPQHVLIFRLTPLKTLYPDHSAILALGQRIQARLQAAPGVVRAELSTALPTGYYALMGGVWVQPAQTFQSHVAGAGPQYFATFGIPVFKGRAFSRTDTSGGERVAIVNAAFARAHFGGQALGKAVHATYPEPGSMRVIGVVGDTRNAGPLHPSLPILYLPAAQMPSLASLHFALRVRGNPNAYRNIVGSVVHTVAPMQPIAEVHTLSDMTARHLAPVWFMLLLVGLFASLALLLAAAGIYSVMAVTVAAREHEFGVRTALGASPTRLIRLVLRRGAWQIAIGLAIGIVAAVLLSSTLKAFLAEIGRSSALDPWALVGVCIVLAIAGLLACLVPALRAGHVQPMHALRGE